VFFEGCIQNSAEGWMRITDVVAIDWAYLESELKNAVKEMSSAWEAFQKCKQEQKGKGFTLAEFELGKKYTREALKRLQSIAKFELPKNS
jgi:hypothetical protein